MQATVQTAAQRAARLLQTQSDKAALDGLSWTPNAGPQTTAYASLADEMFYGGQAGGGKTDLLLGLAGTQHWNSVIFRRVFPMLRSVIERSREVYNTANASHSKDSYNESLHIWRLASGRIVEFGALQYEKNKVDWKGRPHDLYGWDELPEFTESQYRFVNGWLRSTRTGQRCRVVATGNPPVTAEGEWVIKYWAPWLDTQHANPAKAGELRWFTVLDGKDVEVESGDPFDFKGELITPKSRTFIPAGLDDNPYLRDSGYRATLMALPEPLRSQLLKGDFSIGIDDDPWQVIPTSWVIAAQERWVNSARPNVQMRSCGVDVARGGRDKTVIAPLYGAFFDELITHPGETTPDGATVARYVTDEVKDKTPIYIDVIGYGASAYDHLKALPNVDVTPVNNSASVSGTDKSGRYEFANVRAFSYWKLREALDPASGENICLPPGREVRIDLCAPRFLTRGGKIVIEPKEDIIQRTGHSPDIGDALALAWYGAAKPRGDFILFGD